jgi:glycosyltransferase involved in cell wall biosynthesis
VNDFPSQSLMLAHSGIIQLMRLAWFSPLPPARSGIATYSGELVPRLVSEHSIDTFDETTVHDFAWRARRNPYDLVVYQLGNAPCHDFMWGYLAAHPGLVVAHDARLHHARARDLLAHERLDDYRREFWYDHPDARRDFVEYAVAGLGGPIYYCWSMLRAVMRTARLVAVHNPRVAADLRDEFPGTAIEAIHLGVALPATDASARARVRRALGVDDDAVLFTAFGKITAEKRVGAILRAFERVARDRGNVHLVLAGDAEGYPALAAMLATSPHAARAHVTGYLADEAVGDYLAAADVCLCLRWPTALETSASWLQCLAAARPTVISDLAHLVDIPTLEPSGWTRSHAVDPVAVRIDLMDEDASLEATLRRLAGDPALREQLGRAGRDYWTAHHTLEIMTGDYRRLIAAAAARPAPSPDNLPLHFTADHSQTAREILRRFEISDFRFQSSEQF